MDQLERITRMESILDEGTVVLCELEEALDRFSELLPQFQELENYYLSQDWRSDYESDAHGEFPPDLQRGVLSEDGIYDLLYKRDELLRRMHGLSPSFFAD